MARYIEATSRIPGYEDCRVAFLETSPGTFHEVTPRREITRKEAAAFIRRVRRDWRAGRGHIAASYHYILQQKAFGRLADVTEREL